MTEPYFNFCSIQENITEIFFEDYGAQSLSIMNPSSLVAYKYLNVRNCQLHFRDSEFRRDYSSLDSF